MEEPIHDVPDASVSFKDLGICDELCLAAARLGYTHPTSIQVQSLPYSLQGKDIIGLALTGSGKTAAFALPILQKLLENPTPIFALVLTPTRELAIQIAQHFDALGSSIGLKTAVIVGGLDLMQQAIAISKKPHVLVGTPGRVVDHLKNTKGFNIDSLKFLVLDEADRLLNMDFEKEITQIVEAAPEDRSTFLFSATMTNKVQKLQRACLKRSAVKVQASQKYETVSTLIQQYQFIPSSQKDTYLFSILNDFLGSSVIIFTDTTANAVRAGAVLEHLGFKASALFGKLTQHKRLEALNKFKSGGRNILVATEVASRGLDIPAVDLVINYDVPQHSKNYIHRVGRTARAGRSGRAITLVTQYDVQLFQRIEALIGQKLEEYKSDIDQVMALHEQVQAALRKAEQAIREKPESDSEEGLDEEGHKVVHKKRFRPDKAIAKRAALKKKFRTK
jgi:ATP-dependent RNA helicase DDX47/RRP3